MVRNRADLKTYILRKLGEPVIEVEIDRVQLELCIEDAMEFFLEHHSASSERIYLKHKITASTMNCSNIQGTFKQKEILRGETSGSTCKFHEANNSSSMFVYGILDNVFTVGETIRGESTGSTCTFGEYISGDIDNKYIPLDEKILAITKVFPISDTFGKNGDIFNVEYQFALESLNHVSNVDVQSFYMFKRHLALLEYLFRAERGVRFNRFVGRAYLDMDWKETFIGRYIMMEAYSQVDPEEFPKIFNNRFLKAYAVALAKQQWGMNLKKLNGLVLLGNVTVNGQDLYNEGTEEIRRLETDEIKRYVKPARIFYG